MPTAGEALLIILVLVAIWGFGRIPAWGDALERLINKRDK